MTALEWFPVNAGPDASVPVKYNDIVRWIYDTLYRMNIECDFAWPDSENIEEYDWVIVPALYAAPEALLHRLNRYVEAGGGVYGASAAAGSSSAVSGNVGSENAVSQDCLKENRKENTDHISVTVSAVPIKSGRLAVQSMIR